MGTSAARKKVASRTKPAKRPVRVLSGGQVAGAVKTLAQPRGGARFRAGKALVVTAERDAARVYPHFDAIAALLKGDSKIVRWNAMQILALLAPVDSARKLDGVIDAYLAFIRGDNLISAANALGGAARIARARPDLLERIVPAILEVENASYETPECRNVAIGQALEALDGLWPSVRQRPDVAGFVGRQQMNPRAAAARRAAQLAKNLPRG